MTKNVQTLLHDTSPYAGFDGKGMSYDPQGWGSDHPVFTQEIERLTPGLIVEVGTWKGASALHMGKLVQRLGVDCEIVCVDSFLGSMEHWITQRGKSELNLEFGHPQLYYQFLFNVLHDGLEDIITPFACTSTQAAKILAHYSIQCDLAYIDAGHEYPDVLTDIEHYWPLVREGGVMIGDDFSNNWPGVMRAAREFSDTNGLPLSIYDYKWVLRKD
ncbi:class I SAM-dependent methyltransferase [Streptomyces sp. NPDC049099]|uniref:class I SAM-dependent methyltransferase n=1 Tax=Streptomyces sp. NPDC049099 TaxID=3155768 RepID=UPI00343D0C70